MYSPALQMIEFSSFTIYLAVFTYLADWYASTEVYVCLRLICSTSSYGTFASSALAGQSLSRNLFGMAFPLFTTQMYDKLTYHWANTLFGCLALLMAPVPFVCRPQSRPRSSRLRAPQVLFYKGPALRARSKFAISDARKD